MAWQGLGGSKKVFLPLGAENRVRAARTCLGGGVFGNSMDWIVGAMRRAFRACQELDLDVRIVTYAGQRLASQGFFYGQGLRDHSCCSWRRNSNENRGAAAISDLFTAPKPLVAVA